MWARNRWLDVEFFGSNVMRLPVNIGMVTMHWAIVVVTVWPFVMVLHRVMNGA